MNTRFNRPGQLRAFAAISPSAPGDQGGKQPLSANIGHELLDSRGNISRKLHYKRRSDEGHFNPLSEALKRAGIGREDLGDGGAL